MFNIAIMFLSSFSILVIVLVVLLKDYKSPINQSFALFSFFALIWLIANNLSNILGGSYYPLVLILNKLIFASTSLASLSLLFFCYFFPSSDKPLAFIFKILLPIPPLFVSFFSFTDLIVKDITFTKDASAISFGPLSTLYAIQFVSYITAAFYFLISNYIKTDGEKKKQMQFLFLGLLLFIVFGVLINLVFPLFFGNFTYTTYGGYLVLFFIGFTSYAILKHHLMDIRIILTETATFIVVIALLVQAFLSKTVPQGIINGIVVLLVAYGGYLLIKSVQEEIKKKEQLQDLTTQLAQANSHLQELDKMKTEFVSLVSHELLTPVSAIEGYLSMLLDEKLAKVEDPKAIKYLDNVYNSAKRLARLVSDLLNISRIEEGRLLVEKKDVNLSEIIEQVIDELKFKAEEHKQKIVFANPDGWTTYGDPDKIKEVMVNLIGNSIKYSKDPGTITVNIAQVPTAQIQETWDKIESEIKNRPLDDQEAIKSAVDPHLRDLVGVNQYLVSVKDQGIGIPKEELPRLFKKFHRVGDFSTAESQGTGLGLYISRALVELNHGRIWADSEGSGKGSTFSFSLPLLNQKQAIVDLEAQAPKPDEQLKPLSHPSKVAEDI